MIFSVGVNNGWNRTDSEEVHRLGAIRKWLSGLRLTRLFHILRYNLRRGFSPSERAVRPDIQRTIFSEEGARVEHRDAVTGELLIRHEGAPGQSIDHEAARLQLHRDLEKIRLITEHEQVKLVLLTYSAFEISGRISGFAVSTIMSQELREFSQRHNLPLVDTHDRFRELLTRDVPRSKYFLNNTEDHPNPAAYAEIAALVVETFEPR